MATDYEYECPDCGTLHYRPVDDLPLARCDCRASALRSAGIDPKTFKDLPIVPHDEQQALHDYLTRNEA